MAETKKAEYEAVADEAKVAEVKSCENEKACEAEREHWSLFFRDGKTSVDFVLAYDAADTDPVHVRKREVFEANLLAEKLVLERDERDSRSPTQLDGVNAASVTNPQVGKDAEAEQPPRPSSALSGNLLSFVKVHAPFEVLAKYAEALKMHMPVKQSVDRFVQKSRVLRTADCRAILEDHEQDQDPESHRLLNDAEAPATQQKQQYGWCERLLRAANVYPALDPLPRRYAVPFSMHRSYLFDLRDREHFFDAKDRSYIVDYILQRKSYTRMPTAIDSALTSVEPPEDDEKHQHAAAPNSDSQPNEMGINRLLKDGVYLAVFPLHDCPLHEDKQGGEDPACSNCVRYKLWREWAQFRNAIKMQPINYIQRYFGDAIAWYFAWLGFYTEWLVPLTLIGIVIFTYGVTTSYDAKVSAFCTANTTMCPLCLQGCPYWQVSSQCLNMLIGRIFENPLTFVWGIVVTMWCTLFLETWKRKQYTLQFEWNLFGIEKDEEPPRPEFAALSQNKQKRFKTRPHPITGRMEPYVPYWTSRLPNYAISITTVLFGMLLIVASVAGVVVYRVVVQTLVFKSGSAFMSSYGSLLASVTGAMINLVLIMVLGFIYNRIAVWLTDREYWRTQSEYDNALMAKLVALQCVNYYSSIVYIAFFKGQFATVGDYAQLDSNQTANMNVDFTIDMCSSGSCLPDLCIQLVIIMCYKQLIQNNVLEILLPKVKLWVRLYMQRREMQKAAESGQHVEIDLEMSEGGSRVCHSPTLHENYKLQEVEERPLFDEYLEMIIQYGFVSIFAIAFPLAPLFALLNNILEIRIDARKFLIELRRPVAEFDVDIGIWYHVLFLLSRIAVLTNGALIAFTSDLVPNLVYTLTPEYSHDTGFRESFNYSLYTSFAFSVLDTKVLNQAGASANRTLKRPDGSIINIDPGTCMYKGFNNPPDAAAPAVPYAYSKIFWHVLAWRIASFVIFENSILLLTELVAYLIPDVPSAIEQRQRRERHLMRRLILKADTLVALKRELRRPSPPKEEPKAAAGNPETAAVVTRQSKRLSGVRLPSVVSDRDVALQQNILAGVKRRSTIEDLDQQQEQIEMQSMPAAQAAPSSQQSPAPSDNAATEEPAPETQPTDALVQRPLGIVPDD